MITEEQLKVIRKQNQKKLESIMKRKDYQVKLAKKYYGKRYEMTFAGEKHPENTQLKPRKR